MVGLAIWLIGLLSFESIWVTAVGDINLGSDYPSEASLPPEAESLLAKIHPLLSGDIVFGNLEGPLLDGGSTSKCQSPANCYAFRTPIRFGSWLKEAGFNVLSIANNHALDFGEAGRESTRAVLDALKIAYSGPINDIAQLEIKGQKVALIAFTTADHSYNLLDIEQARETVRALSQKHEIVIVSFHGGTEGSKAVQVKEEMEYLGQEPRGELVRFAHAVIDAGADLVLGHGPHVLRGLEIYRKRLIAYSLGNFCTFGRFNLQGPLGIGMILKVRLDRNTGEFMEGKLHPTIQIPPNGPVIDDQAQAISLIQKLNQADFRFRAPTVTTEGILQAPPFDMAGFFTRSDPAERKLLMALLERMAKAKLADATLQRWFGDERVGFEPEVLERFARPAEKMPYEKYRLIFVKPEVIQAGKEFLEEQKELLHKIEKKFGVNRELLGGLIATETRFGKHLGPFRVFNALTTLALKSPSDRRKKWAERQLITLLKVFPQDPVAVMGSYAGAIGLVQFLPESIQQYGFDWDQDGKIDLDSYPDALASAANYLKRHGFAFNGRLVPGSKNYKAIFRYNPADNYVKVVRELSFALGYPQTSNPAEK